MRIVAALFRFSSRRCPNVHDSFTLKESRVAAKGRSSFVFSNVPHCIAFAGSSKVVQSCKMKLRASLIHKLGKEVIYIPSFSSLFMREMKMEKLCPDGDSCPMILKAQKNSRILSSIAIYETIYDSSWDCFRLQHGSSKVYYRILSSMKFSPLFSITIYLQNRFR